MSNTLNQLKPPQGEQLTRKEGSLKPKTIDKLDPKQRAWSDNVMRVLGLQSRSSQARVLAGAIAAAQLIEENGTNQEKLTARQLRATVIAAGTPPWKDVRKAMAAGDAKVQLDLLSLPQDKRQLRPLDKDKQGIHQSFWIDRHDADGQERPSFLCKPANTPTAQEMKDRLPDDPVPLGDSGGPKGGEVAREALSGRAAQLLAGQTGIDIGMPETHVVTLDSAMVPGSDPTGPPKITCSVQEARHAPGDLKKLNSIGKMSLKPEQVAGLAIFDTLTLNTDRHGGNVLIDPGGNLVPIDHGESFAESNDQGVGRMKGTLGSPHNALLSLPGAHMPMPKDMLKKLKALDPDKYASGLKKDNAMIGAEHTDMKDAISPGAIENARRAASFVKLAARHDPPLSPASIQVAMGNAADRLFGDAIDDKTFQKNAKAVIDRIAPQQQAVKEICTAPDVEYNTLVAQAEELGWTDIFATRYGAPDGNRVADPVTLLTIVKQKIACPKKFSDIEAKLKEIAEAPKNAQLSPKDAMAAIGEARQKTFDRLIVAMAPPGAREVRQRLATIAQRGEEDKLHDQAMLLSLAITRARENQVSRIAALMANNRIADLQREGLIANQPSLNPLKGAHEALAHDDPLTAAGDVNLLEVAANRGDFIPDSSAMLAKKLRQLGETLMIPDNDADLKQGLTAASKLDPFQAKINLESLQSRNKTGEFIDEPLKLQQAELDDLNAAYTIDPAKGHMAAALAAIRSRDPLAVEAALYELRNAARNSSFPPTDPGMRKLADAMAVPDDDVDLVEALKATAVPDEKAAQALLIKLKDRHKKGEFGTAGIQKVQKQLDDLTGSYNVPAENTDLGLANIYLTQGDPTTAAAHIARLVALAKAGSFVAIRG